MIKKILTLVTLFIGVVSFSQSSHDDRLLKKYGQETLDQMALDTPEEYSILNNALQRGIFIGDIPTEKGKDIQFDGELSVDLSKKHDFISLGIELKENEYQYFKITGTNKLVGVLPKSLLK
jgi:hypothetical protein